MFQFRLLLRLFRNNLRAVRVYTDVFGKNYVDTDFYVIYVLIILCRIRYANVEVLMFIIVLVLMYKIRL